MKKKGNKIDKKFVKINNRLDPVSILYHNGKRIGKIRNNTALMDVCAQVAQLNENGYSILYKNKFYAIEADGTILNTPNGFYDSVDKSGRVIYGF